MSDAFLISYERYLAGEIGYRELHNLDGELMNLERPDGSFNRELAIRLMKWGMFASAFTIVMMIVGAFLVRSLAPLVGVTPNLIAIVA